MTEAELQGGVIDLAQAFRWRVAHFRPAQTERGWRTAVAADGEGYPDLTLVREERLIFAELKGERGRLRPAQTEWLNALALVAGRAERLNAGRAEPLVEVFIWRPSHWQDGTIERTLR